MPATFAYAPGVVAANTATSLPANAPKFVYLLTAEDIESGGSATAPANLTVSHTSGTQPSGTIYLSPVSSSQRVNSWQYGTATTADTTLVFYGYVEGELQPLV